MTLKEKKALEKYMKEKDEKKIQDKQAQLFTTRGNHFFRKINNEEVLNNILDWHLEKGNSYHVISFGDIDSLSYLRFIVKQQKISYLVISTWVMNEKDASELYEWLEKGYIKKIDFYVGEIFKGGYRGVYDALVKLCIKFGGRVCIFKNHSKVMSGFGDKFDFVIESSANMNTNPRCENTCITIDEQLALFYKNFYDDVKSFGNDFDKWEKTIIEGEEHE